MGRVEHLLLLVQTCIHGMPNIRIMIHPSHLQWCHCINSRQSPTLPGKLQQTRSHRMLTIHTNMGLLLFLPSMKETLPCLQHRITNANTAKRQLQSMLQLVLPETVCSAPQLFVYALGRVLCFSMPVNTFKCKHDVRAKVTQLLSLTSSLFDSPASAISVAIELIALQIAFQDGGREPTSRKAKRHICSPSISITPFPIRDNASTWLPLSTSTRKLSTTGSKIADLRRDVEGFQTTSSFTEMV